MKHLSLKLRSTLSIENKPYPRYIPDVLYQNRYCDLEGFSILVCGGKDKRNKKMNIVIEVKVLSFEVTEFLSMLKPLDKSQLVNVNNDILAISDSLEL